MARFDAGEDLVLTLKKCAQEHGIKSAWFNVIGGLKEFTYGLYEKGTYRVITKKAENCIELLPTFGNITMKEGELLVHAHVIGGEESEGKTFGGHLMEGSIIFPFAEVIIQEIDPVINRSYDKTTNLWSLKLR